MVAGKLRRLVPSNTLVRKRSESGGKQATHLALAAGWPAGWHWVACWLAGLLVAACWWPLSEAEPPVPVQCLPACTAAAAATASNYSQQPPHGCLL